MNLKQKIDDDFKEAFKNREEIKTGALKMLRAEMHNAEIAKQKELDDEGVIEVVLREIKKRKDAAVLYEQGKREELAEKEKAETKVLSAYLPEQISETEVRELVKKAIEQLGATSIKEMGKVMGVLAPQIKGKADNSMVSNIVKELLG
jgi:uncharacterized protein YqeY